MGVEVEVRSTTDVNGPVPRLWIRDIVLVPVARLETSALKASPQDKHGPLVSYSS